MDAWQTAGFNKTKLKTVALKIRFGAVNGVLIVYCLDVSIMGSLLCCHEFDKAG